LASGNTSERRSANPLPDSTCDGCRKRFPVEVPDWNARANVVDKLLTQGYGRPRTEEEAPHGLLSGERVLDEGVDHCGVE
jgi:hypothetical protein